MTIKIKKYICIINVLILLFNISIFVDNNILNKFQVIKLTIFKYSDYFDFNLFIHSYRFISSYLNNKYYISNINNISDKYSKKKEINVFITGIKTKQFFLFILNWLKNKISDEFIIKINQSNPDYLIYNCYNNDDLNNKYNNAIKIAFYTENMMIDINYADYVLGNFHINYLDRYFKYSIFLFMNFTDINNKRKEVLKNQIRTNFCAAVISNCKPFYRFRLKFIEKLSNYKKIDMGGKCNNNINKTVENKIDFLSNYKFSISMENSSGDGYLSEKIVDSFLAGTIPIYYGDYMIEEFINPKTYILIKGDKDMEEKIEYIKKIDNDDKLYKDIISQDPFMLNKINSIENKESSFFLKNIFRQNKDKAYRRDDFYKNCNCS